MTIQNQNAAPFDSPEFNDFCEHYQRTRLLAQKHKSANVRVKANELCLGLAFDAYEDAIVNGPIYPKK